MTVEGSLVVSEVSSDRLPVSMVTLPSASVGVGAGVTTGSGLVAGSKLRLERLSLEASFNLR